ncbi:MAG: tail fiber domain-containing protein [Flavobacteriales bacterium]
MSPNNTLWNNGPGPFSRLHLHDGTTNVLQVSYRPWMDNGITCTTNGDQMYIGHKVEPGTDQTSAVIQWGDNDAPAAGPDVLKFLFTSAFTGGSGSSSSDGLELGRFHPQGWLGLGNWQAAAAQPNERLDLLSRTIRLRDFAHPTLYRNDNHDRVLVADAADGRVYWRPASTLSTADCDWVVQPGQPHVSSVYSGSACAWNEKHGVGVGVDVPKFKLHARHFNDELLSPTAVFGESYFDGPQSPGAAVQGVLGRASSVLLSGPLMQQRAYGVKGEAFGSRSTVGVFGNADITAATGGQAAETYGLMGLAMANGNSDHCVGVFGRASGATDPMNDWAGWFEGNVNIQGGNLYINEVLQISDAALKTEIEDAVGMLEVVAALQPMSYQFNTEAVQGMHLPEGPRVGLLAQELEAVLPALVHEVRMPAKYDTLGAMIQAAQTYKTVNYVGLIPYLIGAVKELSAQHAAMQAELAACCIAPPTDSDQRMLHGNGAGMDAEGRLTPAQERLLRIAPNPFTDRTTLYYTLERSGRAQLIANSADGRDLRVLSEAQREAGEYQYVWSTEGLAPGVYYVTLLLDGEPLVKRAVKVGR